MEEILASIRRIISEDGEEEATAPAPQAKPAAAAPRPAPKPAPKAAAPAPAPVEIDEPESPAEDDRANPHLETEDVEMIKKNVAEAFEDDDDAMVDETTAAAASSAFRSLSQSVRVSDGPGKTLEDIVTEMLKPMVKDWLDANLAAIVEEKVEEEVQRVARRRR